MQNKITVSLVQPNFRQGGDTHPQYWLPHSAACVYVYVAEQPRFRDLLRINEIVFRREHTDQLAPRLANDNLVLFSNYMWNWEYNLTLARKIKHLNPQCNIIFGGPQVSEHRLEQQQAQYPFVDTWIVSEGELSFESYIIDYLNSAVKPVYSAQRLQELDIPSPYLTGFFDELMAANPDIKWSTTLETNRGCPFKCTFCDWGSLTYATVKRFPIPKVYQEIEWIAANHIVYVFVADANFGMFKDRDHDIAREMVAAQQRHGYPEVWNANWHKNSRQDVLPIVETLTAGGKNRAMTLSVQSMTDAVQSAIERRNMETTQLESMFDLINSRGLSTYTELILPLPRETAESWREGLARVLDIGQHNSIEIWFHQLLENAESTKTHIDLYGFEYRTLAGYVSGGSEPHDEDILENTDVVVATNTMTYEQFKDCWQYASMIINFHCGGWTQLIARVLVGSGETDYASIYNKLYTALETDNTVIGSEWRRQRADLDSFLNGKAANGFSAHTFLWRFNTVLHTNAEAAWVFIRKALPTYFSLYAAQRDYIHLITDNSTSINTYEHNYFEYLSGFKGPVVKGTHRYRLITDKTPDSLQQHLDNLYYRRRMGYGKKTVQRIH